MPIGPFRQIGETLHVWQSASIERRELAQCPSATCTMSACPGPTSHTRPASRSGRLERCEAGVASHGGAGPTFRPRREHAMTALRLDDLRQYSDMLRLRSGAAVTVRFVESRDAEALQAYFRACRCARATIAFSARPANCRRPHSTFHPCRRGRRLRRLAMMTVDGAETIVGEARYAFDPDAAASNSACRLTTAGRARASARPCS